MKISVLPKLAFIAGLSLFSLSDVKAQSLQTINALYQGIYPEEIYNMPKDYDISMDDENTSGHLEYPKVKGGIDEKILNTLDSNLYKFSETFDYLEQIDADEHNKRWMPLKDFEAIQSRYEIFFTIDKNRKNLKHVDSLSISETEPLLLPLKNLITDLNAYSKKIDKHLNQYEGSINIEKLEYIYNYIKCTVPIAPLPANTSYKDDIKSETIDNLLLGAPGNCNDIVPAYYSLLNYMGFVTYLRFGEIHDLEGNYLGLHTWFGVTIDNHYVDLDPTWHSLFIPLEDRNPKIEKIIR
jgi:hypothetical protein